jgi:hypothetical protein
MDSVRRDDPPARGAWMSPARLGATYIFSGLAKSGASGRLEAAPNSLSPVRNLIFFVEDAGRPGTMACWSTDAKGLVYPIASSGAPRPTPVHYLGKTRRIYLAPPDALLKAWAKSREQWADGLARGLAARTSSYRATELTELEVAKSSLRPPDRQSTDAAEKEWAAFHDGLKGRISAWLLPKTRALVMPFSSASMDGKIVEVTPEGKTTIKCEIRRDSDRAFAVAIGDETTLPPGMYSFKVKLPAVTGEWSNAVQRDSEYQLKEQVRFGITNFAGEFDLVNCDPISVEESVMQQFPDLYWHRIAAAKERSDYPEVETDPEYQDFPKALEQWAERLEWAHSKAKLTVGLINASGWNKRAQLIGMAVWKQLKAPADNEVLNATRNSIDLAFQVGGQVKEWKELLEGMHAEKELAGLKRVLWKDIEGRLERNRWWAWAKEEFLEGDKEWRVLELASATAVERKVILAAGIPEKRTALEEMVGKSAGKAVQKGLVAAQLVIDVYKTALAFNDVLEARKEEGDLVSDLDELFKQVDGTLARSPCREAMGNLERLRSATVAAHRKVDDEEAKALMAAIDAALGALTLVFPAVAIVVAIKEGLSLAKDVAVELAEWGDRLLFKSWAANLLARRWTQLAELASSSSANQSLIPHVGADGGATDLNVQLRLRAEALHGLVGLLTRASVASEKEKDYLDRVEKYRVAEYIRHYLLWDGWQLPIRALVPIGMDAAWMYLTGPYGALQTQVAVTEQLGFAHPLKAAAVSAIPFGMTMLTAVDAVLEGNAIAKYQKTFPIHRLDAAVPEVAMAFRTAWAKIDADAIEYTCVYRRPAGSSGSGGWQPVNAKGVRKVEELDLLSPLDQIRVLVVFKADVPAGTYPLSFQLVRTDGINIEGPVYRQITRRLDADNLLRQEEKFKGRIGCVFYPFFEVGKQMVPGIKPLAAWASFAGVGAYEVFGYLDNMTYGFTIKAGDSKYAPWVKIGAPNAGTSDLDEVRVGITGKPHESSLLVAGFLDSHSEKPPYPQLFQLSKGFGPCYVRVGGGNYLLATPDDGAVLTFDKFSWTDPVDFIVVAYSSSLAYLDWERQGRDWKHLPVQMQLVNFHGLGSDDGPTFSSSLDYVGQLYTARPGISSAAVEPDPEVERWSNQVRANPAELRKLIDGVDPRNFGSLKEKESAYHLFAAHFALDYFLPQGDRVIGLRPFGRTLTGKSEHYRIGVRKLQTPEKCGLEQTKMEASVSAAWFSASGYAMPEYEFRFPAPDSHTSGVPWSSLPAQRRKKWIEEEGRKRNPNVELIAK